MLPGSVFIPAIVQASDPYIRTSAGETVCSIVGTKSTTVSPSTGSFSVWVVTVRVAPTPTWRICAADGVCCSSGDSSHWWLCTGRNRGTWHRGSRKLVRARTRRTLRFSFFKCGHASG